VGSATALNMIDMIGVGPFITVPLIVSAIGGPQAMLGWIVGAVLAMCDGLVWAELGAAMPHAGGSYRYLKEIYGPQSWGRLFSFLFIWQLSFSAPLSVASGSVGLANYASYLWPALQREIAVVPLIGQARIVISVGTLAALGVVVLAVALLYRSIVAVGAVSKFLWVGVLGTVAWIIFAGLTHFDAHRAFDFPPTAFHLSHDFFTGLGAALLIAAYDYWGYYNVCFLGDEVKDPERTIPRALLLSIAAVAVLYVLMNISILGVIPWREMMDPKVANNKYIVSIFMERIYGGWAGKLAAGLIIWTAFASVFSLLLGYSRVPYAAAVDGNYFSAMGRVHPRHRIPHVSLLTLGAVALFACFLDLRDIIAALVVIRIVVQFLLQTIGLLVLRTRHPEFARPFRMWLYPLPALLSAFGFVFILIGRKNFLREIRYAALLVVVGLAVYLVRSWRRQEWPFGLQRIDNSR
jgi:amino acid transporter